MAFKALNIIPVKGYERSKEIGARLRTYTVNTSNKLSSGATSVRVLGVLDSLIGYKTDFNLVKSIPGIAQYAREQENDPNYDAVAEFNTLIAFIDTAISTITSTFPTDASGFLLAYKFNPDGTLTPRSFTAAQMSGLTTALTDITNSIN